MCAASVRSSSRASSSSCTSSIAEDEDSEVSETSDCVAVAAAGGEFVPPRPATAHRTTQRQCNVDNKTPRRKPVLKPSTAQYQSTRIVVTREAAASSSGFGWRTRPQRDGAAPASDTGLPTTPINTGAGGLFKVPRTPPVTSSSRQPGSRIQRVVRGGEDRKGVDGVAPAGRPAANAASEVTRAATPPPSRLHTSSSDMAINTSSLRTQSRIPTRSGARQPQRGAEPSSRASSPGSAK